MNSAGDGSLRGRQLRLAMALVAVVIGVGTAGYMLIEGWNAWDAFYMTVITVTTVGYREVHALSRAGQVFTVLLLFCGVGAALYAFTLVAAGIVEGGLQPRLQEKRRARMIDQLNDHFIVCGYGRIGSIIAEEFRRQHVPFVVIDRDPVAVQEVLRRGDLAVEADASREDVLVQLRIDRARGLIAARRHRRRERLHRPHRPRCCARICSSSRAPKRRMRYARC